MSMISGTLRDRIGNEMERTMNDMSQPGNAAKSGSQTFKHLEALELLPLPICLRNGSAVDVEHASHFEFTAWLKWNGIPFRGLEEWTFDSKCAIINYALAHGLKPRLVERPGNCFGIVSELFVVPKEAIEDDGGDSA